jgi:cytochrome P450
MISIVIQNQKKAIKLITSMLEERKRNPELRKGDFLDLVVADMKTETFLTDNFVIYMMFGLLLASFETISSTLTLAIKLINDHPKVVQQLTVSYTN